MSASNAPSLPPLGDLALRPIVAVARSTTVVEAAGTMREHDIDCLVVAEPGERVAVLTERDVTAAVARGDDPDVGVGSIADPDPLTFPCDASVLETALAMLRAGVRHVVVTRDGHAVGVVSAHEVMGALVEAVVPERLFLIAVRRTSRGR